LYRYKKFTCPECKGEFEHKEVIEKIVSKPIKIGASIRLKNSKNH